MAERNFAELIEPTQEVRLAFFAVCYSRGVDSWFEVSMGMAFFNILRVLILLVRLAVYSVPQLNRQTVIKRETIKLLFKNP